ncbi:unnamed protein product, partial [Nesidiocoris tenuis]
MDPVRNFRGMTTNAFGWKNLAKHFPNIIIVNLYRIHVTGLILFAIIREAPKRQSRSPNKLANMPTA